MVKGEEGGGGKEDEMVRQGSGGRGRFCVVWFMSNRPLVGSYRWQGDELYAVMFSEMQMYSSKTGHTRTHTLKHTHT